MSNGHPPSCRECVKCSECNENAWCLSEPTPFPPCSHDLPLCANCNIENCIDCRREAELEMYRSGNYDPRADPFYNPAAKEAMDAYWASAPPEVPGSPGIFRWPTDKDAS